MPHHFSTLPAKLSLLLLSVVLGDWLMIGVMPGVNLAVLGLIFLLLTAAGSPQLLKLPQGKIGFALMGALLISFGLGGLSGLSGMCFLIGMALLLIIGKRNQIKDAVLLIPDFVSHFLLILGQPLLDARLHEKMVSKNRQRKLGRTSFLPFVIPVVLSVVFIYLFSRANPLLGKYIDQIDISAFLRNLSWGRAFFWVFVGGYSWSLLRPRFKLGMRGPIVAPVKVEKAKQWINAASIIWSLIAFNLIFALQNGMDLLVLWTGQGLPEGVTYAQYAHTGAYPLVLTALLAGAYVLAVFSENKADYHTPLAKRLVYVWIAQNILLIASAFNRLDHYVDVYSLTYLRVAAFIWMGLVAAGFVLIIVRMVKARSNLWLINANVMMLGAVLFVCCFINFGSVIANYNVDHVLKRVAAGENAELDFYYMQIIGPSALPALRRYEAGTNTTTLVLTKTVNALQQAINTRTQDGWRSWTLRHERLKPVPEKTLP